MSFKVAEVRIELTIKWLMRPPSLPRLVPAVNRAQGHASQERPTESNDYCHINVTSIRGCSNYNSRFLNRCQVLPIAMCNLGGTRGALDTANAEMLQTPLSPFSSPQSLYALFFTPDLTYAGVPTEKILTLTRYGYLTLSKLDLEGGCLYQSHYISLSSRSRRYL